MALQGIVMTEFDQQLFILAPLGLALLAIGLVQILGAKLVWYGRAAASAGLFSLAFLAIGTVTDDTRWNLFAVVAPLAVLLVGSLVRVRNFRTLRPVPVGIAIALAGVTILTTAVIRYETGLAEKIETDFSDLELLGFSPAREMDPDRVAVTDRGRVIDLWRPQKTMDPAELRELERRSLELTKAQSDAIPLSLPEETSNCHGWVFTNGRYILANDDIEKILTDNAYQPIRDPKPGDIAIYHMNGRVSHTAIVCACEPGRPVIVESKWSWMSIYRHPVDGSIYGVDYTFYRSPRANHVVKIASRGTPVFSGAE